MKKITLLLFSCLAFVFSWQSNAQLTEGFEAGLVSLTNDTGNGVDWTINTSYFSEGAQSAHNAYASSNNNILVSGAIDISGLTTPRLTFDHIAKTEGTYDFCYVEVSTDGSSWTTLATYDEDSYSEWGTTGTTPANDWWQSEIIDLSSYISATTYIRFRLETDSSVTRYGWLLDNVIVEETPTDQLDYYNLQWPGSGTITDGDGFDVYAQAYEAGLTDVDATPSAGIEAWIGYSTADTDPSGAGWTWVAASPNPGFDFATNNNDEYTLNLDAEVGVGTYYYAARWRLNGGPFTYGGFDAGLGGADGAWDGTEDISGVLTVNPGPGSACSNPISLTVEADCSTATPYTIDYSTATDLGTSDLSCDTVGVNTGAWFEFVAPASGAVLVNASDSNEILVIDACGGTDVVCNSTASTSHDVTGLTSGNTYYLAVWKDSATTGTTDVCIEEVACGIPTAGTASVTIATEASLSWTAGGSETLWDIEVVDITGGGSATGTPTASSVSNPYTATGLTEGNSYEFYVRADCGGAGVSDWAGPFSWAQFLPPANDECDNAIALTVNADYACGVVTPGTNVAATASPQADDVTGTPNTDVWFSFVSTGTAHRVSLDNVTAVTGTSTDMGMGVYDGTGGCAGLVFVDDSDPNTLDLTGLTIGTTYLVRVYGWSSSTPAQTTFDVCVGTPPAAPANDNLCDAIALNVGDSGVSGAYSNSSATTETSEPSGSCFTGGAQKTVWFSFVAPASGQVDISTDIGGTFNDSEIAVYDSTGVTCSDLSTLPAEVGCDQDSGTVVGNGWMSILNLTGLSSGVTYYIQVSGYNNQDGTFGIEVIDPTLSASDFEFSGFKYFPNPVEGTLSLRAQQNIQSVAVYNIMGQEVINISPNALTSDMDMTALSRGTYFVRVSINGAIENFKIIKE